MAQRVGSILKKEKGIQNLIFDTCGVGYFSAAKGYKPDKEALSDMLVKGHVPTSVHFTSLAEVDVPKAEAVFELTILNLA
jgi:hypothetical protein